MKCRKCGKELMDDFEICPYCKTKLKKNEPKDRNVMIFRIVICVMVVSLCFNIIQIVLFSVQQNKLSKAIVLNENEKIVLDSKAEAINNYQESARTNDTPKDESIIGVKELKWMSKYLNGFYHHYDLVLTNNTQSTCVIKYYIEYFDANNNVLGSSSGKTAPVASGQSAFVSASLEDQEYVTAKYQITHEQSDVTPFNPSYVTAEVKNTGVKNKYIISLTNNDAYDYEFAGAYVVFYNNEKVVNVEHVYVNDADNLLPSGMTISDDFSCNKENDKIEYYLFGRYAD